MRRHPACNLKWQCASPFDKLTCTTRDQMGEGFPMLNPEAPAISEVDLEVEELEEKTAPQSDTTYLDCMSSHS